MRGALIFATALMASAAFSPSANAPLEARFEAFVSKYRKAYSNEDLRAHALRCYKQNVAEHAELMKRHPHASFGENEFSDQCPEDFARMHLGAKPPDSLSRPRAPRPLRGRQLEAAQAILRHVGDGGVDWRTKGAVSPIQLQGSCGSCWAFAVISNAESQHFLWAPKENGTLVKLSEEAVVSCDNYTDSSGSDDGCSGGWSDRSFKWLMENHDGLVREEQYPYTQGGPCNRSKLQPPAFEDPIIDFQVLLSNETYIAAYVALYGPVVAAVDATDWQNYNSGILNNSCVFREVNHAVNIVGFGTDAKSGVDYWIIRNSWAKWGEKGYARLIRGNYCNSVPSHVVSALYAERSMCLSPCEKGELCCAGECYRDDGSATCCPEGGGVCKKEDGVCCDDLGDSQCCSDSKFCCGHQCCDPSVSVCSKDRAACCSKEALCGGECCAAGPKTTTACCQPKNGVGAPHCAQIGDNIGLTCCQDGSSCGVLEQCCPQKDGTSVCCPWGHACQKDGSCPGIALPDFVRPVLAEDSTYHANPVHTEQH